MDPPPRYRILNTYSEFYILDAMMILGCVGLAVCYAIARSFDPPHVGKFCDISDLVVNLPERIIFRLDFSILGGTLFLGALPIRDVVARRVDGKWPTVGAFFQMLSGVGVVLVAACGPHEIKWFHVVAATLGFGGSGIAQILYGIALLQEDQPTPSARVLFAVRCSISVAFISSAIIYGLANQGIVHVPNLGHISEWSMWVFLLSWYYTFRFDMTRPSENFFIATVKEITPEYLHDPLQGYVA